MFWSMTWLVPDRDISDSHRSLSEPLYLTKFWQSPYLKLIYLFAANFSSFYLELTSLSAKNLSVVDHNHHIAVDPSDNLQQIWHQWFFCVAFLFVFSFGSCCHDQYDIKMSVLWWLKNRYWESTFHSVHTMKRQHYSNIPGMHVTYFPRLVRWEPIIIFACTSRSHILHHNFWLMVAAVDGK